MKQVRVVRLLHSQLANECIMVSYGFLPIVLQVWVAEGWQVCAAYAAADLV